LTDQTQKNYEPLKTGTNLL